MGDGNLAACLRANELVESYVGAGHGDPDDLRATLVDIVADVLHVARDEGFDIVALMAMAETHEMAERAS